MRTIAILIFGLIVAGTAARAQDVGQLCSRATMTAAANGRVIAESFILGGTERYLCVYEPSSLVPGSQHPLLLALHGGSGNASQMMEDARGIIAAAEAMGAIAVFPNGLPRDSCGTTPCLDNFWEAPENVFFAAALIDRQKAAGRVLEERVHLVGFSGGASLIYRIAATPGFPHAIHSIATVAGAFALFSAERPEQGFEVVQLHQGVPAGALLVQGGADPRLPAAGGLDETARESHASFRSKVDYWRLATGTASTAPDPIDVLALDPGAPADVAAARYRHASATVLEVLDPGLGHAWPDWNVMALATELFER